MLNLKFLIITDILNSNWKNRWKRKRGHLDTKKAETQKKSRDT